MKTRRTAHVVGTLAVATSLALAGCAADDPSSGEPDAAQAPAAQGEDAAGGGQQGGGGQEEQADPVAADQLERQVILSGAMTLSSDDSDQTIEQVRSVADEVGGFVAGTDVRRNHLGLLRGSITIRVPADAYQALRDELSGLDVTVVSETASTEDVTNQLVDLEANLRNQKRLEEELLAVLEEVRDSSGTQGLLDVFDKIATVRGRIEQLEASRVALQDQVALSTLVVTVEPSEAAAAEAALVPEQNRGLAWDPGVQVESAWDRTIVGLQGFVDVMITLLLTGLPLLVVWLSPLALVWAGWRWWRRRHPPRPKPARAVAGRAGDWRPPAAAPAPAGEQSPPASSANQPVAAEPAPDVADDEPVPADEPDEPDEPDPTDAT